MMDKSYWRVLAVILLAALGALLLWALAPRGGDSVSGKPSYMIYYGAVDERVLTAAAQYDIVILHPVTGNVTRAQVERLQNAGTLVFCYLSIGEDLRTAWLTPEQMLADSRFTGDGSGPRVDPRAKGDDSLAGVDPKGTDSPGGSGFASYYLDDNDQDGLPDFNINFHCAFTNAGDPAWYKALEDMTVDGPDGVAGIREILTLDYGRGLGCDGVFLDTVDTCSPNSFTADDDPARTRFEWTAPGTANFIQRLKENYPDKLVCQNRGLFFYNPRLPQYAYNPRAWVDYVMFENYRLDTSEARLFSEDLFADNKFNYAPKLQAEAGRPDGFYVLSLDYAEGPAEYELAQTIQGSSRAGLDALLTDIQEANQVGFSHYIADRNLAALNHFVRDHGNRQDKTAPVWSSTAGNTGGLVPRVGIGEAVTSPGGVTVRWDVALDENPVSYTLYYQEEPFRFSENGQFLADHALNLTPETGTGYGDLDRPEAWPYEAQISGLEEGREYYFLLRAQDIYGNEERNTVVLQAVAG